MKTETKTETEIKTKANANVKLVTEAGNVTRINNKNKKINEIDKENIEEIMFVELFVISKSNKKNIKLEILNYYEKISKRERQEQKLSINKY